MTNWRSGMSRVASIGEERLAVPESSLAFHRIGGCGSPSSPRTRGHTPAASRATSRPSPASWTAPGHDVRVLAPFDPDRRRTAWLHRGARPQARDRARVAGAARRRRSAGRPTAPSPTSRGTPYARLDAAARAARRRLRRRARARAGRAGRRLGRADERRRAARRHVPLLLGVGAAAQGRGAARRAAQAQPPERARSRSPRPRPGPAGASTAAATA